MDATPFYPICRKFAAGSGVTISRSLGTVGTMFEHTARHSSRHSGRIPADRRLGRAMRIAVPTILVAALLPAVVATTAHADEEINPSLSVEAATVVDLNGNPIPVSQDPGDPDGDS